MLNMRHVNHDFSDLMMSAFWSCLGFVDEREDKGIPSSHGIAIGANKTFNETWMIFGRLGFSDGATPIYNETVTIGAGRMIRQWSDVFGIGVNWGQSPDDSLPAQWTTEVFYRMQLSQNL